MRAPAFSAPRWQGFRLLEMNRVRIDPGSLLAIDRQPCLQAIRTSFGSHKVDLGSGLFGHDCAVMNEPQVSDDGYSRPKMSAGDPRPVEAVAS